MAGEEAVGGVAAVCCGGEGEQEGAQEPSGGDGSLYAALASACARAPSEPVVHALQQRAWRAWGALPSPRALLALVAHVATGGCPMHAWGVGLGP
jgi:hypothetical protein